MKKILLFSAALLALAACHKEPYGEGDNEYLVYTSPAKDVEFTQFQTYHIADSVLVLGQGDKPVYSKSRDAVELILQLRENMQKRGFTFVPNAEDADLGAQITYVIKTEKFVQYYGNQYWWYDYPGYWPSGYWGDWRGYYYPRPVVYTYTTNALLMDLMDLKNETNDDKKLEVVWTSYIGGPAGSAIPGAQKRMIDAIDQAFDQSPYIEAADTSNDLKVK